MYELVVIYPIIHTHYIKKALEKLYENTPKGTFKVIVVDQTVDGCYDLIKDHVNFYIRPERNLGFAKAANEGIIHAYRWGVPYICVANDDTEAMPGWWPGVKEEFATDDKILAVCPESPRVPLWGYGRNHGEVIDIVPYKNAYSEADMAYLRAGNYQDLLERYTTEEIPNSFPLEKRGVIDGIAMWMPVFKRESFDIVGYFDERFIWGGGEDYDMLGRAYAKGYRMVSSMKSWCWHWWGKSKDVRPELDQRLFVGEEPWNDLNYLWPPEDNFGFHMDPWGHFTHPVTGEKTPLKRIEEVKIKPL